MKSFIRWEGNKSKYLSHLLPEIPQNYKKYIEPFVGSGALFLKIQPSKWIINDMNEDLILLWSLVRDNPKNIIAKMKAFSKQFNVMTEEDKLFLCRKITERLNTQSNGSNRAINVLMMKSLVYMGHLIIKNKYYFNSFNSDAINTDFPKTQIYFDLLYDISRFMNLTDGQIINKDYKEVLKQAKQNDFVFLDPPYIEEHKYKFSYNVNDMIDSTFLLNLAKEVQKLDKRKAYATELIIRNYTRK
jgi:DNA adenine methylase